MKLIRYRKPSVRNLTGYTRIKHSAKRSFGISQIQGWTRPSRVKQRVKYRSGLYSSSVRIIRNTSKGKIPTLLALFTAKK